MPPTALRAQVGIIGAGPAGLMLAHLLHGFGISTVQLESRSLDYIRRRVRAGVLEQGTVDLLTHHGLGERLAREGLRHEGIELRFDGESHRVDMTALTGRAITVYGQQEVVSDLVARRQADDADLRFEVSDVAIHGADSAQPQITWTEDGTDYVLDCDFIAGCDGFHGISRPALPASRLTVHERVYPFGWLGVLAQAPPRVDELIYAGHPRGFALYSMRSHEVSRLYLQVPAETNIDDWSDERIWDELDERFSLDGKPWSVNRGPIFDKSVAPLRSFVAEPMQFGRLFLAGDAAHIVPPTGAKGLNLAMNDVRILAEALEGYYRTGAEAALNGYSEAALRRIWRAQHFSWWMTSMLHTFNEDTYSEKLRTAQLRNVVESKAYATALAENYVG